MLSEALIGPLKGVYDRTRPPGSLVATTNASFPSGHAIAASVTVIAAVIALVPPGRRRVLWGAAAVAFSIVMGLSRAYLAAHWLSDATAGILLGTSCALITALIADQFQRRHNNRQRPAQAPRPAAPAKTRLRMTPRPPRQAAAPAEDHWNRLSGFGPRLSSGLAGRMVTGVRAWAGGLPQDNGDDERPAGLGRYRQALSQAQVTCHPGFR